MVFVAYQVTLQKVIKQPHSDGHGIVCWSRTMLLVVMFVCRYFICALKRLTCIYVFMIYVTVRCVAGFIAWSDMKM